MRKRSKGSVDIRQTMQPLERLDLSKVTTVGELVAAMAKCSFGAGMLGNAAETLARWHASQGLPAIIYDGPVNASLLHKTLIRSVPALSRGVFTTEQFLNGTSNGENTPAIVVGVPNPRLLPRLASKSRHLIFINQYGLTLPGQYRDGYFPNMVVCDPNFAMPVLFAVLKERLCGESVTVSELMDTLGQGEGLAADVVRGAQILLEMVHDRDTTVFLTLSGAMTVAKMGLLIDDMIRLGMVDYVASTGALMAHGLIEGVGLKHYAYDPRFSDKLLAQQGLNRVTDALEPEENFDHIDKIVHEVLSGFDGSRPISPSEFHAALGCFLSQHYPAERAILASAWEQQVPIVVPAFADSEIGNDCFVHGLWRQREGMKPLIFDQARDTEVLLKLATQAKKLGIFTIGGGVPRNNTQNVAPLIEIINARLGSRLPKGMFYYGVRIDPTPLYFGNLSGCTYSEGGSWRKFDLNGRLAEVQADATIVWPFILKFVLENFQGRDRSKIRHRRGRKVF